METECVNTNIVYGLWADSAGGAKKSEKRAILLCVPVA